MIRIEHINKRFRKLQVLDNVSASFAKGQVVSLIGPNGSGKTTLIKSILGMVKPDSGKIYVDEQLVNSDHTYREKIGYMPQIGRYPDNMIIARTIPGKGVSFAERDFRWHGDPLGKKDVPGDPPKADQVKIALHELRTLGNKIKGEHE